MNDAFPDGFLKFFGEYGSLAVVFARKNFFRQLADSILKRHWGVDGRNGSQGTINYRK
jgi:hypothetical protein